ncbi:hypothetical protein HYFRA_00008317 [Hymenoscyphus fraxineus]|uniref:V-SNARE coiled-coil homology domain-containing protein n=1 Tax=Hymenoscyphus fraxineus TaxID=746836 RepID=A0A9N9KNW2_9HELO|nr:hypothetical protein HYFRA_00008317 [Hymenoscyphus fraxineus]
MADAREPQYDPYIPSGGKPAAGAGGAQGAPGNQRTAALQAPMSEHSRCCDIWNARAEDGRIRQELSMLAVSDGCQPSYHVIFNPPCQRNHFRGGTQSEYLNDRIDSCYSLGLQIDDTVGVMRENINKVSQRGERLDSLQDKTDNLAVSAQGFRRGANRVRKQMWWKDMKMRMCLIAGIVILLVIIIVPAVVATRK